jgi:hypothetical protein
VSPYAQICSISLTVYTQRTKRGAFVTIRNSSGYQVKRIPEPALGDSLAIDPKRKLYSNRRTQGHDRRIKDCMTQIVGGAFCGFSEIGLEDRIIDLLLAKTANLSVDDRAPRDYIAKVLDNALNSILDEMKRLLSPRVDRFLDIFATNIYRPSTRLKWNPFTNNCQDFCNALLKSPKLKNTFSTTWVKCPAPRRSGGILSRLLRPGQTSHVAPLVVEDPDPLYLLSFVCRPKSYARQRINSKYDVPYGLTEEYLLRFRFGRHDESDIIDTLQEYFYDWAAFDRYLYHKYHDFFPWDCTEAYGRYPVKCNDCDISKHVWSFPFDSYSLVQLHLQKDRRFYVPDRSVDQGVSQRLSDEDWMRNRLQVLLAQDALLIGAVAMAKSTTLPKDTLWISNRGLRRDIVRPQGLFSCGPRLERSQDRVKLGGIHRAQPFSHHFERGRYHEYLIAAWAHLVYPLQIKEYELLRDVQMRFPDVPIVRSFFPRRSIRSGGLFSSASEGHQADVGSSSSLTGMDYSTNTLESLQNTFWNTTVDETAFSGSGEIGWLGQPWSEVDNDIFTSDIPSLARSSGSPRTGRSSPHRSLNLNYYPNGWDQPHSSFSGRVPEAVHQQSTHHRDSAQSGRSHSLSQNASHSANKNSRHGAERFRRQRNSARLGPFHVLSQCCQSGTRSVNENSRHNVERSTRRRPSGFFSHYTSHPGHENSRPDERFTHQQNTAQSGLFGFLLGGASHSANGASSHDVERGSQPGEQERSGHGRGIIGSLLAGNRRPLTPRFWLVMCLLVLLGVVAITLAVTLPNLHPTT